MHVADTATDLIQCFLCKSPSKQIVVSVTRFCCMTQVLPVSPKDVGFVLIFSDLHLWASIFSVILVNYIFMDGKSDYLQGKC